MSSETFKTACIARHYGVNIPKVLGWIRAGELRAINIAAKPGGRPRYRITSEALEEFERARSTTKPTPRLHVRRKRLHVTEYV